MSSWKKLFGVKESTKAAARLSRLTNLVSSMMPEGMTPLHLAAVHGTKDETELLLANKTEVNAMNSTRKVGE
jgi:ankyrin repeat protein